MSDTSEIDEPFSSGSSDDYVPESESSDENDAVEVENTPRTGVKKNRRVYFMYPEYGQRIVAVIQGESATSTLRALVNSQIKQNISTKRVERQAMNLKQDDCLTSPKEKRGKHHNRVNAIPPEIVQQVDSHIKSFPR
ncbi:unnamed protein product [Psylliodes chrysocephalus]|uniref:Uncharacterized protein n=1 Tax=Psylliodes chrysocephalus TaxID=3402493 RepID=A0A9P0CY38_9CUCU|nr:unnamed protein product [Psylliodes chrysocephala]